MSAINGSRTPLNSTAIASGVNGTEALSASSYNALPATHAPHRFARLPKEILSGYVNKRFSHTVAGASGLFITLLLFLFMMYISDNFIDSSESTSETIFTLQTIVLEDENQRPDRVRKPAELVDLMEGGNGLVDSQQAYENDEIPVENWRTMFPGQLINEGNTHEETQQ